MADPISIIGTAGAVGNIIDIVAKTIKTIRELIDEYKVADLRFFSLMAQLATLRAAFDKIREWIEMKFGEPHYQLIMDLEMSLSCCKVLMAEIDNALLALRQQKDGSLNSSSKLKLVLSSKRIDNVQKLIEQQTGALTLLLSACNCNTLSEQKSILEQSSTRKALRRIETDSASLIPHRSTDSIVTRLTDNLSKLSVVFDFDHELLSSKVYGGALRNAMKDLIKFQLKNRKTIKAKIRLNAMGHELQRESRRNHQQKQDYEILVLGNENSGKEELINKIKSITEYMAGVSIPWEINPQDFRHEIYAIIVQSTQVLIHELKCLPESHADQQFWNLVMELDKGSLASVGSTLDTLASAIYSIWSDPYVLEFLDGLPTFRRRKIEIFPCIEIKRIFSPDYIPTKYDTEKLPSKCPKIHETQVGLGKFNVRIFDMQSRDQSQREWISAFQHVDTIMFVFNLAEYTDFSLSRLQQSVVHEWLCDFQLNLNSAQFSNPSIFLVLNKCRDFEEDLVHFPFASYIPDYEGENNVSECFQYIVNRFEKLNERGLLIYSYLTDPSDSSITRELLSAIYDSYLSHLLRSRGIA